MKRVYLIGIGGIGMSALARYYKHAGSLVAGYDRTPGKITAELEKEGIEIHFEDNIDLIPSDIRFNTDDTLVIYTPAVPAELNELVYFREGGFRLVKRSLALGEVAATKRTLAVAGTHGKTSTSTLLAHIITSSGKGCTAFLGGISKNYHTNLLLSKGEFLVAEADEFDRSFLQLWPDTAIITSTDADHLDIYSNHKNIKEAFSEFASQIKPGGNLIIKNSLELDMSLNEGVKLHTYSFDNGGDFHAEDVKLLSGGYFSFTLVHPEGRISDCSVGIPGWVNVENGIAASAAALLNGVDEDSIKIALKSFAGVERRFDIHINTPSIAYIDDYAHHPNEISAAISSIRDIFPGRRLTGIFQPHLYTRTRDFAEEFAKSLNMLDELILMDIYPARELPIEGVDSEMILNMMTLEKRRVVKRGELLDYVGSIEPDILITFGAGDIDRFIDPLTEMLKKRYNV
ncbi:MAG: UDP-N-acetylmuramate--L-alanine ligase [Bacteroidales bacterium]